MKLNSASSLIQQAKNSTSPVKEKVSSPEGSSNFADTLKDVISDTNQQLMRADEKQTEFLTSDNKDIHGTMIEMEKAEISLRMLLQIRSKLTTAYEEIMRMQV